MLAVDGSGHPRDGDELIALVALGMAGRGELDGAVVVTVMSQPTASAGHAAGRHRGGQTDVGDRYVLDELANAAGRSGGEQSGHVVDRDLATTGDGILTGLQVLDVVVRTGRTLADAGGGRSCQPRSTCGRCRGRLTRPARCGRGRRRRGHAGLGDAGRVLVRASGTEPCHPGDGGGGDRRRDRGGVRRPCQAVTRAWAGGRPAAACHGGGRGKMGRMCGIVGVAGDRPSVTDSAVPVPRYLGRMALVAAPGSRAPRAGKLAEMVGAVGDRRRAVHHR